MQLYKYQEDYLATLPRNVIMYADLGTGKTAMALNHWKQQNKLLVVVPAAKLRTMDWQEEAKAWLGERVASGITFVSYESLRLTDKKTMRGRWWEYCSHRNGGTVYDIICDEAHALKNPQAKQSKAIAEIVAGGGQFIGATGTPMPNGWIDFAGYSKLFGFTKNITEFKRIYVQEVRYKGFPEIIGYNNIATMDKQLKSIAPYLSREQALELPETQFIRRDIKMTDTEMKKYITVKATRLYHNEPLDNSTRLISVLRQMTTASRIPHLMSILDDTEENVIVFYNYVSEREAILKELAKNKTVLRYDGEVHDKLPTSGDKVKNTVLVAHHKSASQALNLQWANITVYFSPTFSYLDFSQSLGRTHRTGQTKKCVFYMLSVKGTVDARVYKALSTKKDFTNKLVVNYLIDIE